MIKAQKDSSLHNFVGEPAPRMRGSLLLVAALCFE